MANLRIVPATPADVPIIRELIYALADYEKLTHEVVATEARLLETLFGNRPAAEVILAYWEGECAGFALYFPTYSTFLAQPGMYLEDLYVKPHLRGKGIGLALLQHLAAISVERDYGRLEWQVLDWNEPSIRFYKKLGALPMDAWTRYRLTAETIRKLAQPAAGLGA